MSRVFIRALWGKYDKSNRVLRRKNRVDGNIEKMLTKPYHEPWITYVWGTDNKLMLEQMGVKNIILVSPEICQWDLVSMQYRHKLEAIRLAHEEYDQVVQLDWDCFPTRPLPADFWETLEKKHDFQSCLMQYRRIKCGWRKLHPRKVPNGGATYTRGKEQIANIINVWSSDANKNKRSCEPAMSLYVEQLHGKFDPEQYWELHEPQFCDLHRDSAFEKDFRSGKKPRKDSCFVHYQGIGAIP